MPCQITYLQLHSFNGVDKEVKNQKLTIGAGVGKKLISLTVQNKLNDS